MRRRARCSSPSAAGRSESQVKSRHVKASQGRACQVKARQRKARQGKAGQGRARQCTAIQAEARHHKPHKPSQVRASRVKLSRKMLVALGGACAMPTFGPRGPKRPDPSQRDRAAALARGRWRRGASSSGSRVVGGCAHPHVVPTPCSSKRKFASRRRVKPLLEPCARENPMSYVRRVR